MITAYIVQLSPYDIGTPLLFLLYTAEISGVGGVEELDTAKHFKHTA